MPSPAASELTDAPQSSIARRLTWAFWILYALSAVVSVVAPEGRIFLGSLGMAVYWLLVLFFRSSLQKMAIRIRSLRFRFFVIGIVSSDVVMENLAINFKGDLHPNLVINTFLWLGSCLGLLTAWWIMARRYRFTPHQVFFVTGLLGVLMERNEMIPKLLIAGQWGVALLAAPLIVVVYGAAVAPAFLLSGGPPGAEVRQPGLGAIAAALMLAAAMFYGVGTLWITVFRPLFVS
jgi:hypothetical protein